jgi:eukaryotic-like serine/threonine-protein kinase
MRNKNGDASSLNPESWRRIGAVLDRVSALDPRLQPDALAEACRIEGVPIQDVEPYLAAERSATSLPDRLSPDVVDRALQEFLTENAAPAFPPGTRIGSYEVVAGLGAGGMGEVYRARDTRLDRTVALKRLNADVAWRPEGHARFEREARAISRLNHPHICTLFDVIQVDGTDFLVMELVDGETLAGRLQRGPLTVSETIRLGAQIADALAAAHRQNVVHRDLKPANIMLTSRGIKLLDFGLAALRGEDPLSGDPHLTTTGTILGTPAYMAPEQLQGRPVDARADLFALGAVMHEMLTGRRAFEGESSAEVAVAILEHDPQPISKVRDDVPEALNRAIRACLAKNPDERWQNAADLARQLQWSGTSSGSAPRSEPRSAPRRLRGWIAATVVSAAIATAALTWSLAGDTVALPLPQLARFALAPPDGLSYDRIHALSPDASRIAFVTLDNNGRRALWTRALDVLSPQRHSGTEGASYPFWSPDGRFIAFFADNALKKLELATGTVETICKCETGNGGGGSWNHDDVILFSKGLVMSPLWRVPASGGTPVGITPPASSDGPGLRHTNVWPRFLPDGRHYLWMAGGTEAGVLGLYVGTLGSTDRKRLMEFPRGAGAVAQRTRGWYAGGHLFFVRDQALMAQRFSLEALELLGEPVRLVQPVEQTAPGRSFVDVVGSVLAYREPAEERALVRLAWMDRRGTETGALGKPGAFSAIAISRDGRQMLAGSPAGVVRIDTHAGLPTPLGLQGASPVWSPDGKRFAVAGGAVAGPFPSIGSVANPRDITPLKMPATGQAWPTDWSSNGRYIVGQALHADTQLDVWAVDVLADPPVVTYLQRAPGNQQDQRLSPDGRWVAYASNDRSDTFEVYVRPFPEGPGVWRVSTGGGRLPLWTRDGGELLYVAPDGMLMAASIRAGASFSATTPRPLFQHEALRTNFVRELAGRSYDTTDGQRILLRIPLNNPEPTPIVVVLNWERLLPRSTVR